jgi:membrane protease YdiL (CAAX protease family)
VPTWPVGGNGLIGVAFVGAAIVAAAATGKAQVLWLLLLAAPVLEEVVFRAGLQEALLRRFGDRGNAVALLINCVTALAFAAAHLLRQSPMLAALTVLPALLIGALYQRQRRLWPCIGTHSLFNGLWLLWNLP